MRILDGRFAEEQNPIPPPIEIFHPVFAAFVAESRDPNLEVPESLVQQIPEFMRRVSNICTKEGSRYLDTRELLTKLLGVPIRPLILENRYTPDHGFVYSRANGDPIGNTAVAIIEERSELGSGNDAVVQCSFSYREYWAQQGQQVSHSPLTLTSCPSRVLIPIR